MPVETQEVEGSCVGCVSWSVCRENLGCVENGVLHLVDPLVAVGDLDIVPVDVWEREDPNHLEGDDVRYRYQPDGVARCCAVCAVPWSWQLCRLLTVVGQGRVYVAWL